MLLYTKNNRKHNRFIISTIEGTIKLITGFILSTIGGTIGCTIEIYNRVILRTIEGAIK